MIQLNIKMEFYIQNNPRYKPKTKIRNMSMKRTSQLFNLPFLKSYSSSSPKFITISKVHTFLGLNFYSRLNSIYTNLVEAIAKKNIRYINAMVQVQLANKILDQMKSVQENRFKFKMHLPKAKMIVAKNKGLRKLLSFRQNIWSNGVTRIGLRCNVYFGQKFDRDDPFKFNQGNVISKVYRIGQYRYIRYYPQLGIFGNIKNCYKQQSFQLLVKYASKLHLQIQNFDETSMSSTKPDQQIISQLVLKTGNQKFDWVVTDINNMMKKKN